MPDLAAHNEDSLVNRKRSHKGEQGSTLTKKRRKADRESIDEVEKNHDAKQNGDAEMLDDVVNAHLQEAPKSKSRMHETNGNGQKSADNDVAQQRHTGNQWHVARVMGGCYIQHDPKFSMSGEYLFVAKRTALQVLSIENSVEESVIKTKDESHITSYAVSSTNPQLVYVAATSPDRIEVWDWANSVLLESRPITGHIRKICIQNREKSDNGEDVYAIVKLADDWSVVKNADTIYTTQQELVDICVTTSGTIFALGCACIVVGHFNNAEDSTFRTYDLVSGVITYAVYQQSKSTKQKTTEKSKNLYSLAVGCSTGEIFLYEGISFDDKNLPRLLPTPQKLHWHRQAVPALKWSRDGNYLISGGQETVLVIWQLTTGKKQFLPHLSAEIESIEISPDGTNYALKLSDNSIMILSTSDMMPVAHFPDIQPIISANHQPTIHDRFGRSPISHTYDVVLAACLHPKRSNELLLTVPPTLNEKKSSMGVLPRPFLQSFDLSSQRHIYRQALTRSNTTDLATGPEGKLIREPDVNIIKLSTDGTVMASVEVWEPMLEDYDFITHDKQVTLDQTRLDREVYLKFWRWSDSKDCWVMQARIANPHPALKNAHPGRVFDMVSDPSSSSRFYTVGEDNTVRSWSPRQTKDLQAPQEWRCKSTLKLSGNSLGSIDVLDDASPIAGSMAMAEDGSMMAVGVCSSLTATSQIQLINSTPSLGLFTTLPAIPGTIHSICFTSSNIIALTSSVLAIIDVLSLASSRPTPMFPILLMHDIPFPTKRSSQLLFDRKRHLCKSNRPDGPIVFSYPTPPSPAPSSSESETSKIETTIEVYSPIKHKTLFKTSLEGIVSAILPHSSPSTPSNLSSSYDKESSRAAFYIIMADSTIYTVDEPGRSVTDVLKSIQSSSTKTGLDLIDEETEMMVTKPRTTFSNHHERRDDRDGESDGDEHDRGKKVIRPEELAALFDSVGQMSVKNMFDDVVRLFGQ